MSKGSYLSDIDGLRAISVVAVIIFHFLPHSGGAGYLGVDAFFVISGFVISASLRAYPTPAGMQEFLARFYLRRIRRLLPALAFVVLVTALLTVLLTSGSETSLKTGAFSVVGLANFYLYIEATDYFGLTSELNPFTHMWSLAVEDQFYLLFPITVWLLGNRTAPVFDAGRLMRPLLIITTLSFVAFVALYAIDYAFAFYMMPTRFWQIGLGALTYIALSEGAREGWLGKLPVELPVIGMFVVLIFGDLAPAVAHVLIALFTTLALASIWSSERASSLLSFSAFTYIGKISYSLYLWHWPFVVLAKHTVGVTPLSIAVCLLLTFGFAILSYHWVEARFRYGKPLPPEDMLVSQFGKWFAVSVAVCVFVLVVFPRLGSSYNNLLAQAFDIPRVPAPSAHKCHGRARVAEFPDPLSECLGGERTGAKPRKLYLVGDSHANHLIPMLDGILAQSPYELKFANFENRKYGIQALARVGNAIPPDVQYVLDDAQEGDLVIVSFHRGQLNHRRDMHLSLAEEVGHNEESTNLAGNLSYVMSALKEQGVGILLALDTPLMASITTSETCALQIRLSGKSVCQISKRQDLHTRWRQETVFEQLKRDIPEIQVWDPADVIYGKAGRFDVLDVDGDYAMYDWSHVTGKTLLKITPSFTEAFKRASIGN